MPFQKTYKVQSSGLNRVPRSRAQLHACNQNSYQGPWAHWESVYWAVLGILQEPHVSLCLSHPSRLGAGIVHPLSLTCSSPHVHQTPQMAVLELTSHLSNVLLCDNAQPFVKQVLKPQTINQHQVLNVKNNAKKSHNII